MKEKIINIPNTLTLLRIILTPFFIYFVIKGQVSMALLFFVIASLTDLEGNIARKLKQTTYFGRLFDMVADNVLLISSLVLLTYLNYIAPLEFLLIILSGSFEIISCLYIIKIGIKLPSFLINKISAVSFYLLILWYLIQLPYFKILLWFSITLNFVVGVKTIYEAYKIRTTKFS